MLYIFSSDNFSMNIFFRKLHLWTHQELVTSYKPLVFIVKISFKASFTEKYHMISYSQCFLSEFITSSLKRHINSYCHFCIKSYTHILKRHKKEGATANMTKCVSNFMLEMLKSKFKMLQHNSWETEVWCS